MSPNVGWGAGDGRVSLGESSPETTGEQQLQLVNLEASFVCTVRRSYQLFLQRHGFSPGNEISQ